MDTQSPCQKTSEHIATKPSEAELFSENEKSEVGVNENEKKDKSADVFEENGQGLSVAVHCSEGEEDTKSLSSSKDSGCGKSSSEEGCPRNGQNSEQIANSELNSSSILYSGLLFYHTGVPTPKIKESHFNSSPSPSPSPSVSSTSRSFFGGGRWSPFFVSFEDMERPNSGQGRRRSLLTGKIRKDSGAGSPPSTDHSGKDERGHHASCSSFSSTSKDAASRTTNTSSLRALRVVRPSLDTFLEKTQSLSRPGRRRRICEEAALAATSSSPGSTPDREQNLPEPESSLKQVEPEGNLGGGKTPSSFHLARKALRDSFKAARSFLPLPSSSKGNERKTKDSGHRSRQTLSSDENELSATNTSAPNTPIIKKSKLDIARKRFASTLSLNTGSSGGGRASSHRSRSASTLVVSDSTENLDSLDEREAILTKYRSRNENSLSSSNEPECKEKDGLALGKDSLTTEPLARSKKSKKSTFHFIGKSKAKDKEKVEEKSDGLTGCPEMERNLDTEQRNEGNGSEIPTGPGGMGMHREKPSKKRISLVKSIGKAIRSGKVGSSSKEAIKEQAVIFNKTSSAAALEVSEKPGRKGVGKQEIVILENEPKVRTPKGLRKDKALVNRRGGCSSESTTTTSSSVTCTPPLPLERKKVGTRSSSGSSIPDKNCEVEEVEVSETSIDISPRKLSNLTQSLIANDSSNDTEVKSNNNNSSTSSARKIDDSNIFHANDSFPLAKQFLPREESETWGNTSKSRAGREPISKKKNSGLITSLVLSKSHIKKEPGSSRATSDNNKKKHLSLLQSSRNSQEAANMDPMDSPSGVRTAESNNDESLSSSNGDVNRKDMEVSSGKSYSDVVAGNINTSVHYTPNRSNGSEKEGAGQSEVTIVYGRSDTQNGEGSASLDENVDEVQVAPKSLYPKLSSLENDGGGSRHFSQSSKIPNGSAGAAAAVPVQSPNSKLGHANNANIPGTSAVLGQNVNKRRESDADSFKAWNAGEETDPDTACTESFRQLKPFNFESEPAEQGKKERLYKVLVVGELGAGKTSIIKRYVHQFFSQHYRATIGVDFALKVLRWDADTVVRLQLWDIAGQERFGSMTRVYYKEAVGAFVVFDVTRSATLEAVPKWKADLDAKVALPDGRPIPTVLLANKSDQPKEGIAANREKMNEFCQQQGFSAWFETSAKDNINIDESANFLVSKILEMDKWSQEPLASDPDKLDLTANGKPKGTTSNNCAC